MFIRISGLVVLVVMLTACANDRLRTIDSDLGNAVRQNIAVQTVNPDAGGPDGSGSLDGQRAQQAVDRMRSRDPGVTDSNLIQDVGNN